MGAILVALHLLLQPKLATWVLHVGVLDTDTSAVGRPQAIEDVAQPLHRTARQVAHGEEIVEVLVTKAIVRRVEFRKVLGLPTQGVAVRDAVTARAERVNESKDTRILVRHD